MDLWIWVVSEMNSVSELTVISSEVEPLTSAGSEAPEPGAASRRSAEQWLHENLDSLAAAITVAAFGLRFYVAGRNYLNPDEALHYLIINQPNIWLTYKASLSNAHPPLIYLIVYAWHFLGRSELMLRLPSVLAGTAFCWFAYKWMATAMGKAAGLIGLIFCAFSPAAMALSTEVRAYALLLCFMAGALYFLARALEEQSARQMWWFSAFLYLAILSHYSALFFTVALGLYALARFANLESPRKLAVPWALGQAGALMLYGFLYLTHISKLKNSIAVWSTMFDASYYEPSRANIFEFTLQRTRGIFLFLFGERHVADAMLALFLAGAVFLFARDLLSKGENRRLARMGLLLVVPFFSVWLAAIVRVYPYVASRHTAFLAPFAIAGAAYAVAALTRQKLWAGLLVAGACVAFVNASVKPVELGISNGDESPAQMAAAMNYMHANIPQGDLILVDLQSYMPLTYYFCGPRTIVPMEILGASYFRSACSGNPILSFHNWKVIAPSFARQFEQTARDNQLPPGKRVWLYQTGWGGTIDLDLANFDSRFRCLDAKRFGDGVSVMLFIVGADLKPDAPPGTCANLPSSPPA
jgi:hypothetical protein